MLTDEDAKTRLCEYSVGSDRERYLLRAHHTQTNLVFNMAGVAPVTEPSSDRYNTAADPW
jgi:hypothetical protein